MGDFSDPKRLSIQRRQLAQPKRFVEPRKTGRLFESVTIASRYNDWQTRSDSIDLPRKLGTGKSRHRIIRKNEIDLPCRVQHVERVYSRGRFDCGMAEIHDHRNRAGPDDRIVIDHEHPHWIDLGGARVRMSCYPICGPSVQCGQPELDRGAKTRPTGNPQGAARLAYEAIHHRQSETHAPAHILGRKEWLGRPFSVALSIPQPVSPTPITM
jgi:hypothetical protein